MPGGGDVEELTKELEGNAIEANHEDGKSKKKKKNKSKAKETIVQTDPPSLPIATLFPSGLTYFFQKKF